MIRDKLLKTPSIKIIIDDYIDRRNAENDREKTPFFFHPYFFNLNCKRQQQFYYLESALESRFKPNSGKVNPQLQRIFDNGSSMHERWQKYLEDAGILVEAESRFIDEERRISGYIDAIVEVNNIRYVVELKSINHFSFQKLKEPKPEHCIQVQLYGMITGLDCFVIYENKNTQEIKEFFVRKNDDMIKEIQSMMFAIKESPNTKTILPKTDQINLCQSCRYMNTCYKYPDATFTEIFNVEKLKEME